LLARYGQWVNLAPFLSQVIPVLEAAENADSPKPTARQLAVFNAAIVLYASGGHTVITAARAAEEILSEVVGRETR
jgi:hypothetical protein